MKKIILLSLFLNFVFSTYGQQKSVWTKINGDAIPVYEKLEKVSNPKVFQVYALDLDVLKLKLASAPARATNKTNPGITVAFPTAKGTIENFRVYEAGILHPDLAARYPDIKSYVGVGIDDVSASIRFSTTIFGLHTMTFSAGNYTSYIEPYTKDLKKYMLYSRNNLENTRSFDCDVVESETTENASHSLRSASSTQSNAGVFRVYRLAISTTIEYSTFHINAAGVGSGTAAQKKAAVLAAMNVTMTRVNGLYERDLSLTLEIVANNDVLISLSANDGFTNNNGVTLLGENQAFVTTNIGSANYDIGHIFSTGGGGIAQLGSICNSSGKARGVTGSPAPVGDAFNVDYVAHEMGHQLGGNHTFNGLGENCATDTRNQPTAIEPGSGTTIMAYAGICSPVNVQNFSDDHFSAISIDQIDAVITGSGNCSVNTPNINTAPVIAPLLDFTIPKSTPFILRGNATDSENDPLTYCWEQYDNEISTQPPVATSTSGPNFRSREPIVSPNRFFPIINNVIGNNITPTWEVVPSVARVMDFALTVRDNNVLNGGQTDREDMTVTFASVGPFLVTSPNTNTALQGGSNQTVTWDVAGTTANGINTPYVDIYLSTNSGGAFSVLLASKVPNDGSESITVPNTVGSANRIIVLGHDNIFYDMSNINFPITAAPSTFSIAFNGQAGEQNKAGCVGENIVYTLNYNALAGFSGTTTFSATGNPAGTTVTFSPSSMTATGSVTMTISNTSGVSEGFYPIVVTGTSGATTKNVNLYLQAAEALFLPITLTAPTNAANNQPVDAILTWTADAFAESYDVQVATTNDFTTIVASGNTSATTFTANGLASLTTYFWRVRSKNSACTSAYTDSSQFTTKYCDSYASNNVPVTISTGAASVTNSTITIPDADNMTISDIDVTLNITHTWIRDLNVKLVSPTGTQITLFGSLCSLNTPGFEDANATFDDAAATLVACGTSNPRISGKVRPNQALSALNGQSSQGVWTLRVTDSTSGDGGAINSWSLNICSTSAPLTVEEVGSRFDFSVFPNPSNGSFTVQSNKISSEKTKIQVYDMRGRLIFENQYLGNNSLNETVQLQNAQTGVYLLSVSDGENKEVKRIIIE